MASVAMTTVARVKALLPGLAGSDTTYDAEIQRWIDQLSAAAEKHMNRISLATGTNRDEFFDVRPGQTVFWVKAVPVTSWVTVNNDDARDFAAATVVDSDNYATDDDIGKLEFDGILLAPAAKALKVTYKGGMAADATAFVAAFPDIAGGMDAQIAYLHQRRGQLGATSVSADGSSISVEDPTKWLPVLKRALDAHRRYGRG